ncbi:MAG: hypothetical protein WC783_00900 [Candidatus Paceibacterota bacterium]|jgi:hypothetical protein
MAVKDIQIVKPKIICKSPDCKCRVSGKSNDYCYNSNIEITENGKGTCKNYIK